MAIELSGCYKIVIDSHSVCQRVDTRRRTQRAGHDARHASPVRAEQEVHRSSVILLLLWSLAVIIESAALGLRDALGQLFRLVGLKQHGVFGNKARAPQAQ